MLQQKLQQRLQQKLSPLQIQTIKLIEIPNIELEERIKQEIESNPALEEGENDREESVDKLKEEEDYNTSENEDYSLDDYRTEDDIPDYKLYQSGTEGSHASEQLTTSSSLCDFLLDQLHLQHIDQEMKALAEFVIGNIDHDGYLRRSAESMADDYSFQCGKLIPDSEMKRAVKIVQSLEPTGVAASSLQECLALQLEKKTQTKPVQDALLILSAEFDDFSQKRFKQIEAKTGLSQQEIKNAIEEIVRLNPKPGSEWESDLETSSVKLVPDFILENEDGKLLLSLNNDNIPPLRVNRDYAMMLDHYEKNKEKSKERKDAAMFVKQKIDAAKWFIDAIKQRQETLMRTMSAIIEKQHDFFADGDEAKLKPLILKDIANVTGYDVSTISRVSNSKYIQTEFGVFPIKYFFSEGLTKNEDGEEVSSNEVRTIINDLIESENKADPLTDEKIKDLLKEKGYNIARRTVAKYREQLGYAVARLRREIL